MTFGSKPFRRKRRFDECAVWSIRRLADYDVDRFMNIRGDNLTNPQKSPQNHRKQ